MMRNLTETELDLVSGGQQSNSFSIGLTATSGPTPESTEFIAISFPAGLSASGGTTSGPGQASTSATVSESNSNP
jgi:hypothetical protein